ncbi:calmodulin-like [Rhinolophus ferrumequinum]|nr:calmodulin-like [Rhinolophus ferrumequinum]
MARLPPELCSHTDAASSQLLVPSSDRSPSSWLAASNMAEELSKEQVADFKAAFNRFDKDGDGTINVQELGDVMRTLGQNPSEAELKDIIARVDTDGDGAISFQEFLAEMVKRMKSWGGEQDMKHVFRAFDLDGDGYITVDELKKAMVQVGEKLSQEELEAMIKEADVDQDGKVNYEEFARMLTEK